MNTVNRFSNNVGAARSFNAALIPEALSENHYIEDIADLNLQLLYYYRNLSKVAPELGQAFFSLTPQLLSQFSYTSLESITQATNKSVLMFSLEVLPDNLVDDNLVNSYFNNSKLKSFQTQTLRLVRESARNDIIFAHLISGLSIDELIKIANYSNNDINAYINQHTLFFRFRGNQNALSELLKLPTSRNAKTISLVQML